MSPMQKTRLALQARAFGFALECAQQRARSARECVDPRQRAEMRAQMRWWAVSARFRVVAILAVATAATEAARLSFRARALARIPARRAQVGRRASR